MSAEERSRMPMLPRTWRSLLGAALLLFAALPGICQAQQDVPTVAAASDLQFALEEVAAAFSAATGRKVELAFGSSGNFFRQIRQGAPFQMFLSADEAFVEELAAGGFAEDRGALYAVGRIALIVPRGSALKPDGTLADLAAALRDGRVRRFAIANPEHAPYGRRAEEALRHAGLWDAIEKRLVLGENVSQAAQFAISGGADGGIVAYSLALAPRVARLADHALIPSEWHQPLRQRMVLMNGAGETARMFYAFVAAPEARKILNRYGFVLPGEGM
jgi:molybdate transport system substrate-binding protein